MLRFDLRYFYKHRIVSFFKRVKDLVLNNNKNKYRKKIPKHIPETVVEYNWRGLHFDVARHMFPVSYLEELIKKMSELDLNVLHLHLSDDQGWRFECKKYPRLHEIGGYRKETVVGKSFKFFGLDYKGDGIRYGGYYTQKELKHLVKFAREKGVTIVPEIDLPGHSTAMLTAYPEYSYNDPPKEVATYWGVFDNVIKANEKSVEFLKDVFDELCEVFASKYIHVGGDEVEVKDYDQKYILREIGKYLISKNKVPVIWDEARDVAEELNKLNDNNCIVMVWRSMEDLKDVLAKNIKAICASSSHLYFDYYQKADIEHEPLAIGGYIPIEKVEEVGNFLKNIIMENKKENKDFNPKNLLGAQAQLWTEYIRTPAEANYMLFPRLNTFAKIVNGEK